MSLIRTNLKAFIQAIYLIYEKYKKGEIRIDLTKNTKKGELDNRSFQNYNETVSRFFSVLSET